MRLCYIVLGELKMRYYFVYKDLSLVWGILWIINGGVGGGSGGGGVVMCRGFFCRDSKDRWGLDVEVV